MKKFNIKIGDKEYLIKLSFRSLMTYERLSGKNYTQISSLEDTLIYFYSCLISSNQIALNWDDFLDMVDEYPEALEAFLNSLYEPNKESEETEGK